MPRRRSSGVTYLELLIVCSVLALLAATVVPRVRGTLAHRAHAQAASTLVGVLQYARTRAVAQQEAVRWVLDGEPSEEYRLEARHVGETAWQPVREHWGQPQTLPATCRVTPSLTTVTFWPDGRAEDAVITFTASDRIVTQVTIDADTGSIHAAP